MASIACEDCSHHRHRCPSNTKYCRKCRLLRDVEFWAGKTRTCRTDGCGGDFTPMYRGDNYCGRCNPGQTANRQTCVLCATEAAYCIARDIPVCERCARDGDKRPKMIAALRKGQRKRRENPPAEPLRQPKPRSKPVGSIHDDLADAPEL